MATFRITDNETGKKYDIRANDAAEAEAKLAQHLGVSTEQEEPGMVSGFFENLRGMRPPTQEEAMGAMRSVGEGFALGFGGEAEAGVRSMLPGGGTYEEELAQRNVEQQAYEQANPEAAIAGEVAGAVMSPIGRLRGPAEFEKLAQSGSALVRGGYGAGRGAVTGGIYGAGKSEEDRIEGAKEGAATGALFGFGTQLAADATKALGKTVGAMFKRADSDLHVDKLEQAKNAAWKAVDKKAGNIIGSKDGEAIYTKASDRAAEYGYGPDDGKIKALRNVLSNKFGVGQPEGAAPKVINLKEAQRLRERMWKLHNSGDEVEKVVIRGAIDDLDDAIDAALGAGDKSMRIAREAHRQFKNAETLQKAFDRAEMDGGNTATKYRNAIKSLLRNEREMRFFKPEQQQAMQDFLKYSSSESAMKALGSLSGDGSGFMRILQIGSTAMDPRLAALYGAGMVAKKGSEATAKQRASELVKAMSEGAKSTARTQVPTRAIGALMDDEERLMP